MERISFFRQERFDGGVRAGIGIDESTVLNSFKRGKSESDPGLMWYIDVQFEGRSLPREAEDAREWFLRNKRLVIESLLNCAEHLEIGLDVDESWPFSQRIKGPRGTQGRLTVSGVRRLAEGELSRKLIETAEKFEESLASMKPLVNA